MGLRCSQEDDPRGRRQPDGEVRAPVRAFAAQRESLWQGRAGMLSDEGHAGVRVRVLRDAGEVSRGRHAGHAGATGGRSHREGRGAADRGARGAQAPGRVDAGGPALGVPRGAGLIERAAPRAAGAFEEGVGTWRSCSSSHAPWARP
eukprot:685197-Pyramimonas_sp.AAC.1